MNSERGYPWLKLTTKLINDPRFMRLSDGAIALWLVLFCQAGQADAGGLIASAGAGYPLTNEDIAFITRRDLKQVDLLLEELVNSGFIHKAADGWEIPGFLDEQGSTHAEKREGWKKRQSDRRDNLKREKELKNQELKNQEEEEDKEVTRVSRVTPESEPAPSSQISNSYFQEDNSYYIQAWSKVTQMADIPGGDKPLVLAAMESLRSRLPTVEEAVLYYTPFFQEWKVRNYSRSNCAWLFDWAITGTIPNSKEPEKPKKEYETPYQYKNPDPWAAATPRAPKPEDDPAFQAQIRAALLADRAERKAKREAESNQERQGEL